MEFFLFDSASRKVYFLTYLANKNNKVETCNTYLWMKVEI